MLHEGELVSLTFTAAVIEEETPKSTAYDKKNC
jgi:hypothetical protein